MDPGLQHQVSDRLPERGSARHHAEQPLVRGGKSFPCPGQVANGPGQLGQHGQLGVGRRACPAGHQVGQASRKIGIGRAVRDEPPREHGQQRLSAFRQRRDALHHLQALLGEPIRGLSVFEIPEQPFSRWPPVCGIDRPLQWVGRGWRRTAEEPAEQHELEIRPRSAAHRALAAQVRRHKGQVGRDGCQARPEVLRQAEPQRLRVCRRVKLPAALIYLVGQPFGDAPWASRVQVEHGLVSQQQFQVFRQR